MGDVDVAARRRRVGGLILLGSAVVIGVAFWLAYRYVPDLVVLDLGGPGLVMGLCLTFAVSSLPLLAPQHEPPTDPRHNRWFIAFGLWMTLLPTAGLGYVPDDYRRLARSPDRQRTVVLYHPDTPDACLRVWAGTGVTARLVGEIGDPGLFTAARFQSRDTLVLTDDGTGSDWGITPSPETIRLDPRSGRPLDHTNRPCRAATGRPSR